MMLVLRREVAGRFWLSLIARIITVLLLKEFNHLRPLIALRRGLFRVAAIRRGSAGARVRMRRRRGRFVAVCEQITASAAYL